LPGIEANILFAATAPLPIPALDASFLSIVFHEIPVASVIESTIPEAAAMAAPHGPN
jgi:hypothetical protein